MQLFSAGATIFSKTNKKIAHEKNRPQKLLIISAPNFSLYWPGCPNQPRIDFSCYKYVPRIICLLICDLVVFADFCSLLSLMFRFQNKY